MDTLTLTGQPAAEAGEPVGQLLHRGAAGQPLLIDIVVTPDRLLGAKRQRGDGFQLQGVADDHGALGSPQRADRALRGCLPSLIDQQPAQRFLPQVAEHTGERREGRRDHRDDEEQRLLGRERGAFR
jgi:hypothetical protein